MLGAMDVPAGAAGPWIVLGAVLGILLLVAAAAVALRLRARTPAGAADDAPPAAPPRDDLAEFLARPPGTPGAPEPTGDGWAVLAPAAHPAPQEPARPAPGGGPGATLAALAVVALLLVGVAAALAAAARSPEPATAAAPAPRPTPSPSSTPTPPAADEVDVRLAFGGVVLEEHAVGLTVAHPELELTSDGEGTVARLRLPAANCLAAAAPPDPGDPACRETRTEFAELSTPDLEVTRDGDELTVSGRFATEFRPAGGGVEPTGRSYDVVIGLGDRGADPELTWDGRAVPLR